jgi:two-component system response regulator RpaA
MILESVWGSTHGADLAALRVHINHLRSKIEPDPARPTFIRTEVGSGYRFVLPEASTQPLDRC